MRSDGVWMRICDLDGIEQSSVMVIGDYTLYMNRFTDDTEAPMRIDYTHEPGEAAANTRAVIGLAKRAQAPDGGKLFAGTGAQLLRSAAA